MSNKPYASDWAKVGPKLEYSKELHLWYCHRTKHRYDERSARHNGIIGMGAQLREIIQKTE